jgi:hypothetical protein
MLDSDLLAMEGASLALRDIGLLQVKTKTQAQHAAAASSGSRLSSNKCVVDFTLQYTTPNGILLQVQNPPAPSPASWPAVHQESIIPALLPPAVDPQIDNQHPVQPVDDSTSCRSINNPYFDPPVCQLVMNKVANTIHSLEDSPTKDCYGWDPILDGDNDDSNFDQDLDMPDNLHREISGNTSRMMDHFPLLMEKHIVP